MEGFIALIAFGLIGLIFVLPIAAWVRAGRARKLAKKNEDRFQELTSRLYAIEQQVLKLTKLVARVDELEKEIQLLKAGASVVAPAEPPQPGAKPEAPPVRIEPVVVQPPPPAALQAEKTPAIPPADLRPPAPPVPSQAVRVPAHVPAPPLLASTTAAKPGTGVKAKAKSILSIEETLGTNWLNKVGVVSVVFAVALALNYELKALGPGGKILVGFAVGAALLGPGIYFERRERWRILARAGMGGGWALLYFTTYAMNHVQATRILESESLDLFLLLIVATAMVAHTLRYHSQVVTGLAFLLAFTTLNISRGSVNSLIAGVILALALAAVVYRRRWFELEVVAILAVFLNHYYWLRPIIEAMGARHHPFPELTASTALLISYWLIFRFSYIFRRIDVPNEENVSTVAALLNTFLFHFVIKYQSARPELAFWFLLFVGATEMVLGQLPATRRRRTAFAILTTIGATLLVAALPFRYSGGRLSVLWLMEAEALFLAGVLSREIVFRWLGLLAELVVAWQIVFIDTWHLGYARGLKGVDFSDPRLALVCGLVALVFYANAHWVPKRWTDLIQTDMERTAVRYQSYVAGMVVVVGVWAICTEPWMAVGWAAFALVLAALGSRLKIGELSAQANAFALLALIRALAANFAVVEVSHFDFRAVGTISLVVALLYFTSRWIGHLEEVRRIRIPEAYTWAASFVVALLLWYQLWPASVALGWALTGLILFQLGFERRSSSLRLQAYVFFIASFFRIFLVNFNAVKSPGELSPRVYTTVPLALLFYFVYWRLKEQPRPFLATDGTLRAADTLCYMGTITMAAVMRFELDLDWVAAAWAALLCVLVLLAWQYGRRTFLHQGLLLGAGVFMRTILHNFYERSYFPPASIWQGRMLTVGSTIALLFVALLVAFRLRVAPGDATGPKPNAIRRVFSSFSRRPEQALFFAAFILLTYFLYLELQRYGMTTVAWGAEAVAVFLFALTVKERSFRLSALGLLLLCVGKIYLIDVWNLMPRDKYLTFFALGVALFLVSFLYTRYREVLKEYL